MKATVNYKDDKKDTIVGLTSLRKSTNRKIVSLQYLNKDEDESGVLEIPFSAIKNIILEDFK